MEPTLCDILNIRYPIIMAPMFLVSNIKMLQEAAKSGITAAIPALNFRTIPELEEAIKELKNTCRGPFGINLIVNKSNIFYPQQLEVCCRLKVDYIITSLGSPKEVIEKAHAVGIKVFCDVTDLKYALKVEELGADGIIAVNKEAGGHAGLISGNDLVKELLSHCTIPIISAGGVATNEGVIEKLNLGAAGLSIGSLFIASNEAGVSQEYKQACVDYGAKDIVMTDKLSGTPCTVIETPYVKEIGTTQSWFEKLLNKNKKLKRLVKMLVVRKSMKTLEKAAFGATYKSLWVAGPSIEVVKSIRPISEIVNELMADYDELPR